MIELINGDCLEEMDKLIERGIKVDAIICDPPFGITACKWDSIIPFDEMWLRLNKLIKPNGAIVLFGSEPFSSALRMSNIKHYKYDWIWEKENGSNFATVKYQPFKVHEMVSVFGDFPLSYTKRGLKNYNPQFLQGEPYSIKRKGIQREQMRTGLHKETSLKNKGTRYPRSVIKYNTVRGGHPAEKPVPLMEFLIKTYTNKNELVLDFTMGRGTTGIGCINTSRNFIGIEKDKEKNKGKNKNKSWFDLAKERIYINDKE